MYDTNNEVTLILFMNMIQVILERGVDGEPTSREKNKADRGGWSPGEKDYFFYIAACTTTQIALEEVGKGGRLTMAIKNILDKQESIGTLSYDALFRLINKEFKERGWDKAQTPLYEAENPQTVVLDVSDVKAREEGIVVVDVHGDEVVLDSGYLQFIRPGEYNVFKTTASEESVNQGSSSNDWLATINVTEGLIETTQATGIIRSKKGEITSGCLVYLSVPETINNNIYVCTDKAPQDQYDQLVQHLQSTNIFNVSKQASRDPDLITITQENIKGKNCWVARQGGKILVPPISIGINRESAMSNNLYRYIRYKIILDRAKSPTGVEELLNNVSLKLYKVEHVKAYSKRTKQMRITEGLKGVDISSVIEQRPTFKGHEEDNNGKLKDGTGDAFVFQVTNDNTDVHDTVHICIMLYQFDGAIKAIYPKGRKGKTIELRGGDSAEDICRVYIPQNSLRAMVEPDLNNEEPKQAVDTLVLYASNKAADYGAIEQSCIQTDPDLTPRDVDGFALSDLERFLKVSKRPVPDDDLEDDVKYLIKKVEMTITK